MADIKDLEKAAREGKLDRREFIKRAGALGLAVPFATSLLSQSVHAATPKKGGRYIQGNPHGSTTDSLDPGTHENGFSTVLVYTYANQFNPFGLIAHSHTRLTEKEGLFLYTATISKHQATVL